MVRFLVLFFLSTGFTVGGVGQSAYINFNREYYHLVDRYEIKRGNFIEGFHTGIKPYRRDHVADYIGKLAEDSVFVNSKDQFNLRYLAGDNWEFIYENAPESDLSPLRFIYETPSDFFYYRDRSFDLHINPVLYLNVGAEPSESNPRFRNTRGMEVRGSVDRKIGFYTFLSTTELRFPTWVASYAVGNGAVPGQGFWKRYGGDGYSFLSATGYISFQATEHVSLQFGQDRNFVGEGYRSMILSDFSNPYMFLKINTNIWKLNLTNLWGQMNADVLYDRGAPTDGRYPQKWFSHHRLSANLGRRINVGLFESVMASQFDWNYLSPLIFHRWVEHQLGSPDKVMLGLDMKWNLPKRMQAYGQFALDEFVFNEFFGIGGKQSSRNKYGLQFGIKAIDLLGVSNLDLQLEYNQARPYTYQEKFDFQSFTNYRTPLTHPLGANFREGVGILRYQMTPRLNFQGFLVYQYFGADPDDLSNFGGDLLKNRVNNSTGLFGNVIGQGDPTRVWLGNLVATFMVRHNMFFDLGATYRNRYMIETARSEETHFLQVSLRLNMARFDYNF
ncbi:hypothetical protein ADIS_3983 [Lunatimonas lonarensis]|uniref:Capsule assembly protein Wzi n=1 Tax=Lunatimonas lonarensis TaxID=1232681 RepID=R7ZNB3_9BACT|nr:hypothetical protein [Lunatimonas lonarensis]EON75580.1 hypothetical protein ADIS_3983 [Lunatimonas lonarensis]